MVTKTLILTDSAVSGGGVFVLYIPFGYSVSGVEKIVGGTTATMIAADVVVETK